MKLRTAPWPCLLLAAILLSAGCDEQASEVATEGPPPGVLVAPVAMQAISDSVEYIGRTVAVNDALLRAQVEGYLRKREFAEGDDIEEGAPLFQIDPQIYEAGVAAAEGEVAEVEATLNRANQDVERQTTLVKQDAASSQRLEEAEAAQLQSEAQLLSAKAKLQKAEIDLEHTVIRAPFSGRIGRAFFSIGDLVNPQSGELARLVELDPIYVNFSVSEGDVIAAKRNWQGKGEVPKLAVSLRLPDDSLYEHIGKIDFIDNVVDRKTGTVIVRAVFDNPDKLLVPGLYVRTVLTRNETVDRLVIPQSAVQEDQAGKFVMVVGPDNTVEQRRITTGPAHAGALEVREGLEPDERVIVEGIQKVRPGLEVDAKLAPNPTEGNPEPEQEDGGQDEPTASSDDSDGEPAQDSSTQPEEQRSDSAAGEG